MDQADKHKILSDRAHLIVWSYLKIIYSVRNFLAFSLNRSGNGLKKKKNKTLVEIK